MGISKSVDVKETALWLLFEVLLPAFGEEDGPASLMVDSPGP
jgi:hypothetical protein